MVKKTRASVFLIQVGPKSPLSWSLVELLCVLNVIFCVSFIGSSVMATRLAELQVKITRTTEKLSRYESHEQFLTTCSNLNVIPRGMRLSFGKDALPPSDCLQKTVQEAIQTANKEILLSCRNTYRALIDNERKILDSYMYQAFQSTTFWEFERLHTHQKCLYTRCKQQLSWKKKKKLTKLTDSTTPPNPPPPSKKRRNRRFIRRQANNSPDRAVTEPPPNTVINLSSTILTEDQQRVLSLGPKFCPTPRSLDTQQLNEDVQEGCRKLRLKEIHYDPEKPSSEPPKFYKPSGYSPSRGRDSGLDAYCDTLQTYTENYISTTHHRNNMKKSDRKAMQELRTMVQTRQVRISTADKGGAVVVQNLEDYLSEADRQLSNQNHYRAVTHNPTVQIAKQSNEIVNSLHSQGHIDTHTHNWALTDTKNVRSHIFYHLPKVHKTLQNPPGRPIVSGTNGPTEKLSRIIDHWLQDSVTQLPSYIKDSTDMLQTIQHWNMQHGPFQDVTLVTIDVISLYTNIPHADMVQALHHFCEHTHSSKIPSIDILIQAVQHVLSNNFFTFEDQTFQQIQGTAMGTPMAPAIANLFMGWLESKILKDSPFHIEQDLWKRYIDDIFVLWTHSEKDLQTFTDFLNSLHPTIKFTVTSSTIKLPFLDILIKLEAGKLETELYTKPTDSHSYLHYSSAHPTHCKNNVPYSQFLRIRRLCSQHSDFLIHCSDLTQHLRNRGYPKHIVEKAFNKVKSIPRTQTLEYKQKISTERTPFIVTHNPLNPPLRRWFREFLPILHTSSRLQKAIPSPPLLGERNSKSLKNILMPSSLPIPTDNTLNPGCYKCNKQRCVVCATHMQETRTFSSDHTSETFTIRHNMTCETTNVVYLLFCQKCSHTQYIGETKNSLKQRFYQHRSNINKNTGTPVALHFNSSNHSLSDLRCIAIEKQFTDNYERRLKREAFWMTKLKTVLPHGLNALS